jgi:hypothetical protein
MKILGTFTTIEAFTNLEDFHAYMRPTMKNLRVELVAAKTIQKRTAIRTMMKAVIDKGQRLSVETQSLVGYVNLACPK